MSEYYIGKNNQRLGPFPVESLLANGLTPDTLVWCSGMPGWQKAIEVPEVAVLFAQQPQYQQPQYQQPQYQQPYQQPAMGNYVETPQLGFMDAVKKCIKNYANFNGRARRSEFWWFYLACYVVWGIFAIPIKIFTGMTTSYRAEAFSPGTSLSQLSELADKESFSTTMTLIFGIIFAIVALAMLIPMLSATARRLHDVGKSGHLQWLHLLCGIGIPICLILCIPDGKPEPNQYGESPKFVIKQ